MRSRQEPRHMQPVPTAGGTVGPIATQDAFPVHCVRMPYPLQHCEGQTHTPRAQTQETFAVFLLSDFTHRFYCTLLRGHKTLVASTLFLIKQKSTPAGHTPSGAQPKNRPLHTQKPPSPYISPHSSKTALSILKQKDVTSWTHPPWLGDTSLIRNTSLIRSTSLLGPYTRTSPRVLWWS